MQLGQEYYPKLQCAVPFSPVPGARMLVAPGEDPHELRTTMMRVLPQVAKALEVNPLHSYGGQLGAIVYVITSLKCQRRAGI